MQENKLIEEHIGQGHVRKYIKGRFLGKGGFAKVYELTEIESQKVFAGKIVVKASLVKAKAKEKLQSQIKIHHSLSHPNVVRFLRFFQDSENYYLLLEICPHQTISDLVRRRQKLLQIQVQSYLKQLLDALKYLHSNRVIHRDLKLGNLFLGDKLVLKVGDFGLAAKLSYDGQRRKTICGTPNYIAPQIIDKFSSGHSYEVDIWSFGIIAFTMLAGRPPFETSDVQLTYKKIKNCSYVIPEYFSPQAAALIKSILVIDPTKRPTLKDIQSSPFFSSKFPALMPTSTLSCPPSANFISKYRDRVQKQKVGEQPVIQRIFASTKNLRRGITSQKNQYNLQTTRNSIENVRESSLNRCNTASSGLNKAKIVSCLNESLVGPECWVVRHIDYSSKFGLGYILNTGITGACFNDQTKLIGDSKLQNLVYIERKAGTKQQQVQMIKSSNFPESLTKKMKLIKHFKTQLEDKLKESGTAVPKMETALAKFYVKKWYLTSSALIIKFNVNVTQTIFFDKIEVIYSPDTKSLYYIGPQGSRTLMSEDQACAASGQMSKRVLYARQSYNKYFMVRKASLVQRENEGERQNRESKQPQRKLSSRSVINLKNGVSKENKGMIKSTSNLGRLLGRVIA